MAEQPDAGTQRYAQEQVNLGAEHYRQGRFAEAAAAWGAVPESVPDQYAVAQVDLGIMYGSTGERAPRTTALVIRR